MLCWRSPCLLLRCLLSTTSPTVKIFTSKNFALRVIRLKQWLQQSQSSSPPLKMCWTIWTPGTPPLVGLEWFSWKFYQRCVKQHGESGLTKACLESQISMKEAEDMVMKVKSWLFLDISEKSDLGDWAGHRQREKPACWKHSQHGQVWSTYRSDLFWLKNMNVSIQDGSWKSTCLGSPLTSTTALSMYVNGWSVVICDWLSHCSKSIFLLIYLMNFHCKILTEWINIKNYCLGEHNHRVDQALVSRQIRACPKVNQQSIWL